MAAFGLLTAVLMTVTLNLAHWQWRRSLVKAEQNVAALQQHRQAPITLTGPLPQRLTPFRRVAVEGQWLSDQPLFLDNQVWQGRAGYFVLMPFRVKGENRAIVVNRGWMPKRFGESPRWTSLGPITDTVLLEVRDWQNQRPLLRQEQVIQGLNMDELSRYWRFALHPKGWLELSDRKDGLVRVWPVPGDEEINKHRSYMGQWLLFTVMIFGAYCFYVWKRWSR